MKMNLLVLAALVALSGCASTATTDKLNALESRVAAAEQTANEAASAARQAAGAAAAAAEAKAAADRAMQAAKEAGDRAARIAETCCARK